MSRFRKELLRFAILYAVRASLLANFTDASEPVDYLKQVKPLLEKKCVACHGRLKQEAGLRLDASVAILRGGDSGAVVATQQVDASLLLQRVTADEERMPPPEEGERLHASEVELLRSWIAQGANAPHEELPPDPASHWAFQLPRKTRLPVPRDPAWRENPIDAILAARRETLQLAAVPPARRDQLLRRACLDLIGLPPTVAERRQFLEDESPTAFQRALENLLARPQYAERWGRHWMDVWRYSDWAGFGGEIRYSQRHIWRWRDWILESLDRDKGYDRMLVEMLAGDEVAALQEDILPATGFLSRNWYKFDRNVWLDDVVEHTGKAFLGMTFKCARCHDHKYDPISQEEYYQLRSIFEPYDVRTDRLGAQQDLLKDGLSRVYDARPEAETFLFLRGDPKNPESERPLRPSVPAVLGGSFAVREVALPLQSYYPALAAHRLEELYAASEAEVAQARNQVAAATRLWQQRDLPFHATEAMFVDEDFREERPQSWQVVEGEWEHEERELRQTRLVKDFSSLVTSADHPQDFALTVEFTPVKGSVYRSVGIAFDWVEPQKFQAVYVSAKDAGATVSAFHRVDGKDQYPSEAIVPCQVQVGERVRLQVQVKDRLLNVRVNDRLLLAYRTPIARVSGKLGIWTYDAEARFHQLRVSPLSPQIELSSNLRQNPLTAEDEIKGAELKLAAAECKQRSLELRVRAEQAKYGPKVVDDVELEVFMRSAAEAERESNLAAAEADYHVAEREWTIIQRSESNATEAGKKKLAEAKQKLAAAEMLRTEARERLAEDSREYHSVGTVYPAESTGRRRAFAEWVASIDNPLTARVAVNHVWMRHFGRPLVDKVEDFGLRSPAPPYQQLLDYLAVELMEHDWSLKHLHRLIMQSRTYQLSTAVGSHVASLETDPDNQHYWRMIPRRMEAEAVRDALLFAGGSLDLTRGGPDIDHNQGTAIPRRSIYFRHARERQMEFLKMFDPANPRECYRREESIRPQQALALVSSALSLAESRRLATRLAGEVTPSDDATRFNHEFIGLAFETVLSRTPTVEERQACLEFLSEQADRFERTSELTLIGDSANKVLPSNNPKQRARENLLLVLFNHNDFVVVR